MKIINMFIQSVMAGLCIAIGGTVYLSVNDPIVGALFFSVGLFAVVTNDFYLFTGKVGYILENKPIYLLRLTVIWLGNLAGTAAVGYVLRLTRIGRIAEHAKEIVSVKLDDTLFSVFILAVFCNILMYIAVDGFKQNCHELGKYIGIILAIEVFILCGFEHSVANMFYFSIANVWSSRTFIYLITATAGNMLGGILIPLSRTLKKHEKTELQK